MAQDDVTLKVDGKEYSLNDFEGRAIVEAERAFNVSLFQELDRGSITGVYAILYLVKRQDNPNLTVDEVLSWNLGQVENMMDTQENGTNGGPPTKGKAKPKAGSTSDKPGAQNS
jgi:hypothetical protein